MDPEQPENVVVDTGEPTGEPTQSYADVLNADDTAAPDGVEPGAPPKEEPPAVQEPLFAELVLDEGKKHGFKTEDDFKKFVESNKHLKDGFMRQSDYTRKTQEIAGHFKVLEGIFGHRPEAQELQALKPIISSYYQDAIWQKIIDAKISGKTGDQIISELGATVSKPDESGQGNEGVQALKDEISSLKQELSQFTGKFTEREELEKKRESEKTWSSWMEKQKGQADFEFNEDIDGAMATFVTALSANNPEWDDHKVLDEAYRRAVILLHPEKITNKEVNKVLTDADKAKGKLPPNITPKAPTKPDSARTYSDIFLGQ